MAIVLSPVSNILIVLPCICKHIHILRNTDLIHLIKHLIHPGKYITKHKSWDKPTKTTKLWE